MKDNKDNIHEELKEISPFLAQIQQKETSFKVPNGYFNHLEDNILARIKAEEKTNNWASTSTKINDTAQQNWLSKTINWLLQPQIRVSFAVILIIGVVSIIWNNTPNTGSVSISSIEAAEYVQENIDQFSETLIIEAIEEENWAIVELSDEVEIDFDEYIENDLIEELDSELMNELL